MSPSIFDDPYQEQYQTLIDMPNQAALDQTGPLARLAQPVSPLGITPVRAPTGYNDPAAQAMPDFSQITQPYDTALAGVGTNMAALNDQRSALLQQRSAADNIGNGSWGGMIGQVLAPLITGFALGKPELAGVGISSNLTGYYNNLAEDEKQKKAALDQQIQFSQTLIGDSVAQQRALELAKLSGLTSANEGQMRGEYPNTPEFAARMAAQKDLYQAQQNLELKNKEKFYDYSNSDPQLTPEAIARARSAGIPLPDNATESQLKPYETISKAEASKTQHEAQIEAQRQRVISKINNELQNSASSKPVNEAIQAYNNLKGILDGKDNSSTSFQFSMEALNRLVNPGRAANQGMMEALEGGIPMSDRMRMAASKYLNGGKEALSPELRQEMLRIGRESFLSRMRGYKQGTVDPVMNRIGRLEDTPLNIDPRELNFLRDIPSEDFGAIDSASGSGSAPSILDSQIMDRFRKIRGGQ